MIRFGPAGLGPVKTALNILEEYHKKGIMACEIAFTYGVYIKDNEAEAIAQKAKEMDIELSIHAPYYVNLNSDDPIKIEASKKRILDCCRIGEKLGAKIVVFHAGFYGKYREKAFGNILEAVNDILFEIKKNRWKIKIAPETMGKVNVFGSIEEIAKLKNESGCSFCIDFAHILARDKKVDYEKVKELFPEDEWHVHFSGINYGEKGEKNHIPTEKAEWKKLLNNLPKDKKIRIINEAPFPVDDSLEGIKIYQEI
jgi:deoxyribonuclease-4